MSETVDPVFEQALREALAQFNLLLRTAGKIAQEAERDRIRGIVEGHEDDDARIPGVLVDQILDEIGVEGE